MTSAAGLPESSSPVELGPRAMERWGRRLGAEAAAVGAFVALTGPLGAGKTTLVRAACRGLGVDDPVLSPTFTLVHTYRGRGGLLVHHADLYRLEGGPEELREIGWEELLRAEGPVFVEWAERAGPELPADRWDVALAFGPGPGTRRVAATARGALPAPPPPRHRPTVEVG